MNMYSEQLNEFLVQAKTDNLKTKHFKKKYFGTKVKVSFGQGVSARIPWISFLKEPFTTSEGIYPVYLYYKNENKLILAYGVSETKKPQTQWEISEPRMVKDFFLENFLSKPDRYGSSYVFKSYDTNNLPDNKTLDKDLNQIIEQYHTVTLDKELKEVKQENFEITTFQTATKDSGLTYSNQLITRYVSSLVTKPFVLLSGLSGSGKTKLAQSFAQWICESENQYKIVPVGADWTNREPLLGYVNALNPEEYILPENGALQLIIEANKEENENKPYFLILDEMNLSHVERYFADFLSVMESKDRFKLHSSETPLEGGDGIKVLKEYPWPKNLFVVGTVNIDETTYMFSPKVLDRANVIEFRINASEMDVFLTQAKELTNLSGEGAAMAESFISIAKNKAKVNPESLKNTLNRFFTTLQQVGAEFGYRTASEIQTLIGQIAVINPTITSSDDFEKYASEDDYKIDIAIMQKLLPKLHGSRSKLVDILSVLASICYDKENTPEIKNIFSPKQIEEYNEYVIYPVSLEKISRMYYNVVANGFTSYAEA